MGVIAWLVPGLAGAIAKAVLPGRDPGGIGTTPIGITGAFLGGWLSAEFLDRPSQRELFDAATWGSAIAGALVVLIAYRLLFGNSRDGQGTSRDRAEPEARSRHPSTFSTVM